ncbi:hypothetical protein I3843_15G067600 [Carya illinoinensis]|uniref:Glycosyltransferase n=2 Tax=Carya illinoinensis TaxID=32201 RepID=A0A8T1ND46_CARIL|nr:hypothetical protein CIPAW_15G073600 [Carya illinoinensis]KAG6674889.1 hypothetical protein I3842_15G070200 [Carya illinoinensis]KAG7943867.1 hypothetical protein I3843_15G067600 [Carya illinoinensis]
MKVPHVAVLSSLGMGHVIPLLELAKCLVVHHHCHVSFLNITTEASAAQNELLHSPGTLPPGLHVIDLPPVDISSLVSDETPIVSRLSINLQESLSYSLKSVLIELGKLQALVIDLFCSQAFEISKDLSVPTYSFCTASAAFLALSLYLPGLDREVECEFIDLESIQVPNCAPVRIEDLAEEVRNRKADDFKWLLLHFSRLPMATRIFLNSWEDLEPVSLKAIREHSFYHQIPTPKICAIGPLIKHDDVAMTEADVECQAWLDKQPLDSVLLIALGSGGTLTAAQLTELAWGLELSRQRFILVARKPTDASASGMFFNVGGDVNDPKAYLPEGFLERTKGVGLVLPSWAPQLMVLRHPSTGAFISHCGWNSILESISHDVPMITWPLYAEQRMNATMLVEEVGVAVKLTGGPEKGNIVGREVIERVIRMVMKGDEGKMMRDRAGELKDSAQKALSFGGSSYESLSCVVEEWKKKIMP